MTRAFLASLIVLLAAHALPAADRETSGAELLSECKKGLNADFLNYGICMGFIRAVWQMSEKGCGPAGITWGRVIENNGTAGGTIAHGRTARAAPDGYTFSLGHTGTHVLNGAVYSLLYDVVKDFEPVSLVSSNPWLFAAKSTVPANDLNGFVSWLKATAGTALQGISLIGTPDHVAGVLLQSIMGIRWQFVPYRGGAPLMQDLVAGQIDWAISPPDLSLPQMRAGRIKIYAVAAPRRLPVAPDIPTVDEAGLPGFYVSFWHGLWAPRGTPKEIVTTINAALVDALADRGIRQRFAEIGQEIFPREQQNPQALAALQMAEIEKWWAIIKAAGIRAE